MIDRVPLLTDSEITAGIHQAKISPRKRYAKVLHEEGAEFNEVFNFINQASYMHPHLHPGNEKIEKIYILKGSAAVLFFNETGEITDCSILDSTTNKVITVPAYVWHTYVMLTDWVITYETMDGRYDPATWKTLAPWACSEDSTGAGIYLEQLMSTAQLVQTELQKNQESR